MSLRVAFHTLGCKLNQLETESFADAFARRGAIARALDAECRDPFDLVVLNTCTVTSKAEQKARRIVRLALAANPEAVALVTGCYAQVEAEALAALDDRVLVLPGAGKAAILGLPDWLFDRRYLGAEPPFGAEGLLRALLEWRAEGSSAAGGASPNGSSVDDRFAYNPEAFAFHARPSLKIQDGCDNACSFCRVRVARGRATSIPRFEALARARALEEAGRAEIVLTGVNLSQYRDDDVDFPGFLRFLVAGTRRIAFRLSSYEPDRINAAFLEAFADPRVRPHVHLAVQSGADPVLAAMGRRYRRADVLAAVGALRRVKGDLFIAADLIAGFPGETEEDAAATIELARECGFAWIHAFRFSPRPGTQAASLPRRVPERVAGERAAALLDLGRKGRSDYAQRWIGIEAQAVLEGSSRATTDNYLKLMLRDIPVGIRPGRLVSCVIESRCDASSEDSADALARYCGPYRG